MIKVVNKKKEEPKIYHQVCEECGTELEFEYSDTYEGALSLRFIKCPECGQELAVEDVDDEKENIQQKHNTQNIAPKLIGTYQAQYTSTLYP